MQLSKKSAEESIAQYYLAHGHHVHFDNIFYGHLHLSGTARN